MRKTSLQLARAILFFAATALAAGPAFADKPEWAGGGKEKKEKKEKKDKQHKAQKKGGDGQGAHVEMRGYFNDKHKQHARQYFDDRAKAGRCPPGLAKKNNGCMPPGQAKKWAVGEPLPHDVVYYNLPPRLVVQLGHPPAGYRYVRVATDILLIAIGTGMVVDAIEDLMSM